MNKTAWPVAVAFVAVFGVIPILQGIPPACAETEAGIPVRVPVPAIIGKCETLVPPIIMTAIINQETHGNPYSIFNNTTDQSLTYPTYAQAVSAGEAFRANGDSVDEGITQVNSIYHPSYSSPYLFKPCGGIHAGANVFDSMWKRYGSSSSNVLIDAYRSIEHYNGNAQSSKCYGEEALLSVGINIGLHECDGAASARGGTPGILKIEDASGGYISGGTEMVNNGGIVSTDNASNDLVNVSQSSFDGSSTVKAEKMPNTEAKKSHESAGLIDTILIVLSLIILVIFLVFTGAISWTVAMSIGSAVTSTVTSIASAAASAAASVKNLGK
ncbi:MULTISPECIES: transglycosylase SLT domain-containing protein [Acidithiobacillus]|uniref:transglycosylase SLT domain-containing protein n=1 Tax=Acidithiobacillus TaxID=119977 RepID=UPI0004E27700|nr:MULTISPECIES: transglycosylase SLT domain-containing protein [Acidithiobacillus]